MKKAIRILIPLVLVLAIIVCTGWYLFVYDRAFTRDILLYAARYFESNGNHSTSAWFYDRAYRQSGDNEAVAIELANQYKASGNYTKAEFTLSKAIADGGGIDLYIALCKTYVEQDKLLDAVNMLNNVANQDIKAQLDAMRPAQPACTPDPVTSGAYYTQYITVSVTADKGTLYVNTAGQFPSTATDRYAQAITLHDGENKLYAIAVGDNGLVSPTAIFGFTVGGVIKQVEFVDATMEKAFRETLNIAEGKPVFTNDLWKITEFTVPEGVESLQDLQNLVFLKTLTISGGVSGQLSHISALANLAELNISGITVSADELPLIGRLPGLKKLTLNNCSLSTLAGLESAKGLTHLTLSSNAIRNLSPLSTLTALQELDLSHNALNDLTPLTGLKALTVLDVSYNNLSTLSPVFAIPALQKLEAGNNSLTELTGLTQLTGLTHLGLAYNSIADISPVEACTALVDLNVSNNALEDIGVLASLTKLMNLKFANNSVKALPAFTSESALVNIDGSYNKIKTLKPLAGLKYLNNVYMDYNTDISSVSELATCPLLIQVNVYGTKVRQVGELTSQSVVVNYTPA